MDSESPGVNTSTASPAVDTSFGTASQPSDTGAGTQAGQSAQGRGPIPYERWEQFNRQQKMREAEWQRERAELQRQLQQRQVDPNQKRLNELLLKKLDPPKEYDDPLEERFDGLHKQYEGRFSQYDQQLAAVREETRQLQVERQAAALEQEYKAHLANPSYAAVASFAQSERGQEFLNMFLSSKPTATMAQAFDYLQGIREGLTPQQAAAQATAGGAAPAAPKKPPVLDTPGSGGAARTQGKPRTMEEARRGFRAALDGLK